MLKHTEAVAESEVGCDMRGTVGRPGTSSEYELDQAIGSPHRVTESGGCGWAYSDGKEKEPQLQRLTGKKGPQ